MTQASEVWTVGAGRYELVRSLGSGTYGTVWLARDLDEDDLVAVKLFEAEVRPDAVLIEAGLHRKLSAHPRVVSLRNVDLRSGGAPVIAMDYVSAGSLEDRLETGLPSLVLATRWTRDVLEGLAHAHAMGVIHRDIKPANVLLNGVERALICDFGVSEDTILGFRADERMYPPLIAPELEAGAPPTARSDVFAVGVLLYCMLVGSYPFDGPDEAVAADWVRPHRVNLQVPVAITKIVEMALQPEPEARYPDSDAMLQAVANLTLHASWSTFQEPETVAAWRTEVAPVPYEIRIILRRGEYEVRAKHGGDGRLLSRRVERHASVAQARKVARRWLLEVVQGGRL